MPVKPSVASVWGLRAVIALSSACHEEPPVPRPTSANTAASPASAAPASPARGALAAGPLVAIPGAFFMGRGLRCATASSSIEPPLDPEPIHGERYWGPAFAMQDAVASCADYDRCVAAGQCHPEREPRCEAGVAVVTHAAAVEYCRALYMKLPTYAQWQHAIRGADGRVRPEPSGQIERGSDGRVVYRTAAGVTFSVGTESSSDWAREFDCGHDRGEWAVLPLAIVLDEDRLDERVAGYRGFASFRCVSDGA